MGANTMGPAARRQAKRDSGLWKLPKDEMPDSDMMVLLLVDDEDEAFVTAGYWSGSCWRDAIGAKPVRCVRGWMHMHDAIAALKKTRGEVGRAVR